MHLEWLACGLTDPFRWHWVKNPNVLLPTSGHHLILSTYFLVPAYYHQYFLRHSLHMRYPLTSFHVAFIGCAVVECGRCRKEAKREKRGKCCAKGPDRCMDIVGHFKTKAPIGIRRGHHNHSNTWSLDCAWPLRHHFVLKAFWPSPPPLRNDMYVPSMVPRNLNLWLLSDLSKAIQLRNKFWLQHKNSFYTPAYNQKAPLLLLMNHINT